MDREREPSSSSAAVGFRPWVLILLFSLLILLVLPSSFRGFRPFAIRNGWDTLIILLVLFAILCGVLSRRHGADDGDRLPRPADHGDWRRAHSSYAYPHPVEVAPEAGGLRMSSGGGSYPVLRPPLDAGAEEWRFYGDEQHYRRGSESGVWERERFADSEAKTISGDTYVERSSPLARSRSPSSLPPPTQRSMGSRTLYELPEGQGKKGDILEPEKPHPLSPLQPPPPPPPPQRQSRMTRRRRVEKVAEEKEVEKNEIFGQENHHSLSSSPSPPPRQRQPMRRSMEKFRERDVGQNAICEAKMTDFPLPAPSKSRHGRMRSVGDVPQWEVEQNPNILVEKPLTSPLNPPPSPPQHQEEAVEEEELVEKTSLKKRRSGGAKDIASAIALLYPKKKKGSKTKKSSNDTALLSAEPSSSAPPPPPTLPSSVFHHLFYQKKGGNKARQIHSESATPPPPLPMPPPPEQQSTQQAIQSAPAPSSHNWHHKGKEKVYLYESPLSPPPAPPSLLEKSNLSKHTLQASSSMSPTPPRPPPPPPRRPPHSHQTVTDEEVAANHNLNRRVIEGQAMKLKEREAVPVSCPSQDVDDKADLFIARLHANWKLEKQKSKRDKERRKQESQLRRA